MPDMWLHPIPMLLREQALTALERGNVTLFLGSADNTRSLELVARNQGELKKRGLYEAALLAAFTRTRVNNHAWSYSMLRYFFRCADKQRLRAAGDPLPGPGPFTIYRGVAGKGRSRRIRGFSWTASMKEARWFAERFAGMFHDPAVYQVTVSADDVLAYINERQEQEFVVMLPESARPVRVWPEREMSA